MSGWRGLAGRLDAFDEALALADGRVDAAALAEAEAVRARGTERLARGDELVVAAFAGGTGTGKSSLFNAVAGEPLAETGVRRPVTSEPQALVVGDLEEATPLMEWLGVRRRHVTDGNGLPDGLILVDLPDHDSIASDHHESSTRLTKRVDLVVWVVDPLKYSRRDLHHAALRPLAAHADILYVVLNHADALGEDDRRACTDDLRRLLDEEGLGEATVLVTSARTGEGIPGLRDHLVREARRRRAAAVRVGADLRLAAQRLLAVALGEADRPQRVDVDDRRLVASLAGAAGVEGRADAAASEYRGAARSASYPVLTGWIAALWALVRAAVRSGRDRFPGPRRSSRATAPDTAAPSAVRHAVIELVDAVGGALPRAARAALHEAAGADAVALGRDVVRAVDAVALHPPRRQWWTLARLVLSVAEVAALIGFGWLAAAAIVDWLRLPELPMPHVAGELTWPTALLLAGLAGRLIGGIVRRRAIAVGAGRHREAVRERLAAATARVARERIVEPLCAELDDLERLVDALDRAQR